MRTITTTLYSYSELSEEAKFRAIKDEISGQVEMLNTEAGQEYIPEYIQKAIDRTERLQTPWFLEQEIYNNGKEELESILQSFGSAFAKNGELIEIEEESA